MEISQNFTESSVTESDGLNSSSDVHRRLIISGVSLGCCLTSAAGSILALGCAFLISHGDRKKKTFYKWIIGERLIVYLSVIDLIFCSNGIMEQVLQLYQTKSAEYNIPVELCKGIAFISLSIILAQISLELFIAINAFVMVVRSKKLYLGRRDALLFIPVLGIPLAITAVCLETNMMTNEQMTRNYWCSIADDMWMKILTGIVFSTLVAIMTLYISVWVKLKQSEPEVVMKSAGNSRKRKYQKSARIMAILVMAFLIQFWPYIVYSFSSWIKGQIGFIENVLVSSFTNLGGILNFLAYTHIRKYYLSKGSKWASSDNPKEASQNQSSV